MCKELARNTRNSTETERIQEILPNNVTICTNIIEVDLKSQDFEAAEAKKRGKQTKKSNWRGRESNPGPTECTYHRTALNVQGIGQKYAKSH